MTCDTCGRLEGILVESIVFADKAETALRCYFITHQHLATVSDMDEYRALREEQQRAAEGRHQASWIWSIMREITPIAEGRSRLNQNKSGSPIVRHRSVLRVAMYRPRRDFETRTIH